MYSFLPAATYNEQFTLTDNRKLSCRKEAMLHVTEYFAKSLKVIQDDILE